MEKFQIIRASAGYELVIVVTPPNADADNPKAQYFIHDQDTQKSGDPYFSSLSKEAVRQYFSGQADGMGFGTLPEKPFDSLEEVKKWILETRTELGRKLEKKIGPVSLLRVYNQMMSTLSTVKGYCEWCKREDQPTLAASFFTKREDNSRDGPWKKLGFRHFEFVTIICKECLLNIPALRKHFESKKVTEIYIELRTSKTGTIPYNQFLWSGIVPLKEAVIKKVLERVPNKK